MPAATVTTGQACHDTGRRLVAGSLARLANLALQVGVAFVMTPLIVHALGERRFGFWTIVCTFVGYYGVLDLGIHSAVCRYVSSAWQAGDQGQVEEVASTSLALFTILGLLALAITAVAWLTCAVMVDAANEAQTLRTMLLILGTRTALGFPCRVYAAMLSADLRYDLTSVAAITRLGVTNGMLLVALRQDRVLDAMALALLLGGAVEYVLWAVFFRWTRPDVRLSFRKYDGRTRHLILGYSWKSLIVQIAGILRLRLNAIIVGAFLNVSLVAHYAIGERLANYFIEFISSIIGNLSPLFSRYEGQRQNRLIEDFMFMTRIGVLVSVLTASAMIFYGAAFIERWMGAQYRGSYYVMLILTVPLTVDLMQTPTIGLLYGTSRHHITAVLATTGGLLNLSLTTLLVKPWGVYGVATASAVAILLVKAVLQPLWVCRALKLSTATYYGALAGALVRSLAPQLLYFAAVHSFLRPEYSRMLLLLAGQAVLSVPLAVFWALPRRELGTIVGALATRWAARALRGTCRCRSDDA